MNELTQIYWMFRCTEKQYAETFCSKGRIKLNIPKFWIELEKKEGKGRGDLSEGVYCSFPSVDIESFLTLKNFRKNVSAYRLGNLCHLRSDDTIELPCFCLFGLYSNSFQYRYFKETNKWATVAYVKDRYFKDFYSYESRETIECLPDKYKPVFIIIKSPNKFFERIFTYFETLGISRNEVIINPIKYIDKEIPFLLRADSPVELFFKDLRFSDQSELRIVINTKNMQALNQLQKQNFIIDIGDLSDITEIYQYYLEDMLIELDNMKLRYTLPEPIITKYEDMSEEELLSLACIYKYNLSEEEPPLLSKEQVEYMSNYIDTILRDKYGVYSYYYEPEE